MMVCASMRGVSGLRSMTHAPACSRRRCDSSASVLVPLTSASSRGDQLLNANYMEKKGYAKVVDQNTATTDSLVAAIDEVYQQRAQYVERMCEDTRSDGTETILTIIKKAATNG